MRTGLVLGFAALETIELRIALQWLGYTVGEVIAESVIPAMGATYSCVPGGMIYLRAGGIGCSMLQSYSVFISHSVAYSVWGSEAFTWDRFFVSDAFGLSGGLVVLAPDWTIRGFDAFNPSGVIANHIAAGILGILGFTNRYPGT